MACKHKFSSDLDLKNLDFSPTTLIVGTFNPEWPTSNTAEWFYGYTEDNYLWDILPRVYGEESLINATPLPWKQFCHDKQIAFTDLIRSVDDADPDSKKHNNMLGGMNDNALVYNFDDFEFVNIVQLLKTHPSIKNVYITRGVTEAFWKYLWNPVTHYCHHNGIRERQLLTPTIGQASDYHTLYNEQHPDKQITRLEDYLLMRWKEDWHF